MFEAVSKLGVELEELASIPKPEDLSREVASFVSRVAEEANLAFKDVHAALSEVAFIPPAQVSAEKILELQKRLSDCYAQEKFKNVLGICDRLSILAENYEVSIAPHLGRKDPQSHSELFRLLSQHEGAFIYTIKSAVREINSILDDYQTADKLGDARRRARSALESLQSGLEAINSARNRVVSLLPGGNLLLLQERRVADEVLRRSPWFSGFFYLATALLLLTALTIVAGNVSAIVFPMVVAGTFIGLTIVGAFQLKNDNRLSEAGFLHLVDLAMRRVLLPLSRKAS